MTKLPIEKQDLGQGISAEGSTFLFPAEGGEITLHGFASTAERYFAFTAVCEEDRSGVFELRFYAKGGETPRLIFRFGLMPRLKVRTFMDLNWLDGHVLFPGHAAGQLKTVIHGSRIERGEIERAAFYARPCFRPVRVLLEDLCFLDTPPEPLSLQETKMIDRFGQNALKDWQGKVYSEEELTKKLQTMLETPLPHNDAKTKYGGNAGRKLIPGSGFFAGTKQNDRWYLADPEGCAFFSMGPDVTGANKDGRIDGVEKLLEWIPEQGSEEYKRFLETRKANPNYAAEAGRNEPTMISFTGINLYRAWGEKWYANWQLLMEKTILSNGMNTLGNWSDPGLFGKIRVPYVAPLPEFPGTKDFIFRDFPDVLSPEYAQNAERCAASMPWSKDDPWMIGYFLRNEPAWAFVNNVNLADEVFRSPVKTFCKAELIKRLEKQYGSISRFNSAYKLSLKDFEELEKPIPAMSSASSEAKRDMADFSRGLVKAYVEIPAKACRKADPNHMILGMRWAWISDPDLVAGWENFDVFSINCYDEDPAESLENVRKLGVDLPIMIGEFHFGALDMGPTATGLMGVRSQRDRGLAYRYYCERTAAHPYGVGCHYFQMYDQFGLGRYDGENYNIGLLDICSLPYKDMMEQVKLCGEGIYEIMDGTKKPTGVRADIIPMIAY